MTGQYGLLSRIGDTLLLENELEEKLSKQQDIISAKPHPEFYDYSEWWEVLEQSWKKQCTWRLPGTNFFLSLHLSR